MKTRGSESSSSRGRRPIFTRLGRACQLVVSEVADLRWVLDMDEALWVANTVPLMSLRADRAFLEYVDCDHDGLIKAGELRAAIRWTLDVLRDYSGLMEGRDGVAESAVDGDHPDGREIRQTLRRIRAAGGTADGVVTLAQIREAHRHYERQPVSETGVLLAEAVEGRLREFVEAVIAATGGKEHPGGGAGLSREQVEHFISRVCAYRLWAEKEVEAAERSGLGEGAAAAYRVYREVEGILDRYFAACEMAAVAPFTREWLWPLVEGERDRVRGMSAAELRALLGKCLPAEPRDDGALVLSAVVNREWRPRIERFWKSVVEPLMGPGTGAIAAEQWALIRRRVQEYGRWLDACPAPELRGIEDRLRDYVQAGYGEELGRYFERGEATAIDMEGLRKAEKLALYQQNLVALVNNFVSFPYLYEAERRAMFEEGELVMDGRIFRLAVRVTDRAVHKQAASRNPLFTMYVQIRREQPRSELQVAVPVTWGTRGNLRPGKRGIFRHVDGSEWVAEVKEIVDYPVSLWEAVMRPFRKMGEALTRRFEQMTSTAERKLEAVTAGREKVPVSSGMAAGGILAGGGIALAALGSSVAYIVKTLSALKWWQMVSGLGAAVAAVLLPGIILAELRLRRADLSSLLEGVGWGINAQMRLSRWQRRFFTYRPPYPAESRFIPTRNVRLIVLGAVAVLLLVVKLLQREWFH